MQYFDWRRGWARRRGLREVRQCRDTLGDLSDQDLRRTAESWRVRLAVGRDTRRLKAEICAGAAIAVRRELGLVLHDAQLLGGWCLCGGRIVEMATGEGKTVTAALAACYFGLMGKGCHVVTANDYLAHRDAVAMRGVFSRLGLSVGCVDAGMVDTERRRQYARDITYGTGSEFGFDFLKDQIRRGPDRARRTANVEFPIQRRLFSAIVDEADNIMIDDARTPLIVGVEAAREPQWPDLFRWCDQTAYGLVEGRDFGVDRVLGEAFLTECGARLTAVKPKPSTMRGFSHEQIWTQIENSLAARNVLARNRDYVVVDGEVNIVSESTGRSLRGRRWQAGLQQAIEAKEQLDYSLETQTAATIPIQNYLARYEHLSGLTGTASSAAGEFHRVYRLHVDRIAPHLPCQRQVWRPRVFVSNQERNRALVLEVRNLIERRRAVLIGSASVASSEEISTLLSALGIEHAVLNAVQHADEAEIVAAAGQVGRVTVATNMAGRGTDIALSNTVRAAGGLHVIATGLHSSIRIDHQLFGRAARQGDPGSCRCLWSLEDELLRKYPEFWRHAIPPLSGELGARWLRRLRRFQRRVERHESRQRWRYLQVLRRERVAILEAGMCPELEWPTALSGGA